MALRDFLNKSKYNEPIGFGDSAPTLAIKLGKKLFGNKTTTRTLPNNGGTYTAPTVGVQPQQDFSGLYGTNQNYAGPGGFNYATPEAAQAANSDLNQVSQDDSEYAGLLDGSGSSYVGTPSNHDTMYTMSKIDEAFGGKSPEDLWTLRQQLARQQALALGGILPAQGENAFNGAGVTNGTPNYDLETRMRLNKSAADIFSPQIENLDAYLHDTVDKAKGGTSTSIDTSMVPQELSGLNVNRIIDVAAMSGKSIDERASIRNMLAQSLQSGNLSSFINDVSGYGKEKMSTVEHEDYDKLQPNIDALQTAIGYIEQYNGKLGKLKNVKNQIGKTFGYGDPRYAMINFLTEGPSAAERQKVFGSSLTGGEQEAASKFVITSSDNKETAKQKAQAMIIAMQMAQEIKPLQKVMGEKEILELKNQGVIKSYTDRLIENGITPPAKPSFPYTQVGSDGKKYRVISATEVVPLDSFNEVGSGTKQASGKEIVAGYDITSYATDPTHGKKVQNIYSKIPENLDAYISRIAPNSPIKTQNVLASANKYGVDPKLVLAIMVQDSTLGTRGKAVRTRNPGNVGNTDSGATRTYATWQDGVDAVAKNLSRRKIYNV